MSIYRYCILLIFLSFGTSIAHSQESRAEVYIDFRVNSSVVDSAFSANAVHLREMKDFLRNIREDHTMKIVDVSFRGAASPEGSDQLNRRLARERLTALEEEVRREVDIPDSLITRSDSYIPWDLLKSQVEASDLPRKDAVMAILEDEAPSADGELPHTHIDKRIERLKALDAGKTWQLMKKRFFHRMRNACAVLVTYKQATPSVSDSVCHADAIAAESASELVEASPDTALAVNASAAEARKWGRKLYVGTNAVGLGMGVANIATELDLAQHWSFCLPVYYCAWNYFKPTIKFRVFSFHPEFRYWLTENNDGLYAGVHFGMGFYNFAFNGDYRYQRHGGGVPLNGGGVDVGYRMPFSRNRRWHMEFSLGAGVYPLHYDKFRNTPNTKDGLLTGSMRKTYWGIDQIAVSFSYMFDLKKKGGKR